MKKPGKLVALAGLMLFVSPSGMCTQRIGWIVPSQFHEEAQDPARPVRTFYLDGESPEHWTERVRIEQTELPLGATFKAQLDAEHQTAGETCPDIYITTFPTQQDGGIRIFAEMRQCPEDFTSHRSAVSVRRMILDGNTVATIIAEGDYPPVPKGKTPLLKGQLSRWMDFVNSFVPCLDPTNAGCLRDPTELVNATAARLGPDESALVQQIEARGEEMYRQDQLAWHSTDALRERNLPMPSGNGGFLAVPEAGSAGKFFIIADKPNGYTVLHVVTTDAQGVHSVSDGTRDDLSPEVAVRFRALQTAMKASPSVCAPHPNTLVLPTGNGDGWWVYVMTASSDAPRMWIGGHTRFRVSKDGLHVLAREPSAKSCLEFDLGDPRMAYAVMTHLISDTPTEFHVMQSLTWHKPMFVGTRTGIWKVDGDSIVKLQLPSGIH